MTPVIEWNSTAEVVSLLFVEALLNYEKAQCINEMWTVDKVWMTHYTPVVIYCLTVMYIVLAMHVHTFFIHMLLFLKHHLHELAFEKCVIIWRCLHQTLQDSIV